MGTSPGIPNTLIKSLIRRCFSAQETGGLETGRSLEHTGPTTMLMSARLRESLYNPKCQGGGE